jgi:hypothetical protein
MAICSIIRTVCKTIRGVPRSDQVTAGSGETARSEGHGWRIAREKSAFSASAYSCSQGSSWPAPRKRVAHVRRSLSCGRSLRPASRRVDSFATMTNVFQRWPAARQLRGGGRGQRFFPPACSRRAGGLSSVFRITGPSARWPVPSSQKFMFWDGILSRRVQFLAGPPAVAPRLFPPGS